MELIDIYTELRDIKGKDYRKTILRRLTSDPARRQLLKLGGHDVDEKVSEETVLDILETVMLTPMFFFRVYEARIAELTRPCQPGS